MSGAGLRVRIRGIYATALTAILIDRGVTIAEPSPAIRDRFGLPDAQVTPDLWLNDRTDRQGVRIRAGGDAFALFRPLLRELLPRTVIRPHPSADGGEPVWSAEFPAQVKQQLDSVRARVRPTLPGHHHLKIIDSALVDEAEQELSSHPEREQELLHVLRHDLIERHFVLGARIVVEHVKPAGQEYQLRGRVEEFDGHHLRLHRTFRPGGHYDSLNVPRRDGDFGHLELEEGSGISIRTYRRRDGRLLGELYNLATPAELYPGIVRYLDLELDVLHAPPDPPGIIDQDDLERVVRLGLLEEPLINDAWAMAREVMERLEAGGNALNDAG